MTRVEDLQLPSEAAKFLRDQGIAMAAQAADRQNPLWQHRAMDALLAYLQTQDKEFMTEDFRQWAETEGNLPTPPSGRAYGSVMTAAYRNKVIKHKGYQRTTNPAAHSTPASIWITNKNK